jgi:NTP pyrophosphatase (non-canonical NTP hydrolase)
MNWNEYTEGVKRTELSAEQYIEAGERLKNMARLRHASDGLVTESSEFVDQLKKHCFYGTELDTVNLEEELGDLCWYLAVACDELKMDFGAMCQQNIDKLKIRYPQKFSKECASTRDLENERKHLEDSAQG